MTHTLLAYGTLRPSRRGEGTEVVTIKGTMYDLGWFPGVVLGGDTDIICERVELKTENQFDGYEGYRPDDPNGSLYIRRKIGDDFVYEFNQLNNWKKEPTIVPGGDWLKYVAERDQLLGLIAERDQNGER